MRRLTVLGLIFAIISSTGCFGNSATAPTNYSIVSPVTEIFQGTLAANGSAFYSFIIGNPDPVRVTLASLTLTSSGAAVTTSVKLGFGVPDGTTCAPTFSTTTGAALVAQYFQVASPGTYCVIVSDPGTMTTSLNFAVRIIHS